MSDDDLIRRGDALKAIIDAMNVSCASTDPKEAIRAIPATDARAEALKEAEKALRDWQDSLNVHRMTETAIAVGMAADVVAALIPETKP